VRLTWTQRARRDRNAIITLPPRAHTRCVLEAGGSLERPSGFSRLHAPQRLVGCELEF
jgi:hypothetical protein